MRKALDLINKIAEKKGATQGTTFVAPSSERHVIKVEGLDYYLIPDHKPDCALGLWRVNGEASMFLREAEPEERLHFANVLPTRKAIVADNRVHVWSNQDCPQEWYPLVNLSVRDLQPFDFVTCGYSGTVFYAVYPPGRNVLSNQLRQALVQEITPADLTLKNLTPEMRVVYQRMYDLTVRSDADRLRDRIDEVMAFTGAELEDMRVDEDEIIVRYTIKSVGRHVTSRIDPETFKVISAGVCLNRGDQNYHLQTLIPVIEHGYRHSLGDWY